MGKSTINVVFSIAMLNYQRVSCKVGRQETEEAFGGMALRTRLMLLDAGHLYETFQNTRENRIRELETETATKLPASL